METLQTCAGLESGIDAAIHAVRKSFEEDNSECLLLVDAENAFNKLNRKVSLEKHQKTVSPIYTYLHNNYNTPSMLYLENGNHMLSQEGVTQGDNAARPCMYALSTRPLVLLRPVAVTIWTSTYGLEPVLYNRLLIEPSGTNRSHVHTAFYVPRDSIFTPFAECVFLLTFLCMYLRYRRTSLVLFFVSSAVSELSSA